MKQLFVAAGMAAAVLGVCGSNLWAQGTETGPAVFWASDPVRPGEAAMAIGENLGGTRAVEIVRLPDGRAGKPTAEAFAWPKRSTMVETLQSGAQSVKFLVPKSLKPGLFAVRVANREGAAVRVLNRPQVWWTQGDGGTTATPGGWVRAFGKNLGWDAKDGLRMPALRLEGPCELSLPVETDGHAARAVLPENLPAGMYRLSIHGGAGGDRGWSDPIELTVVHKEAWPQTVYNVTNFGAQADGVKDDTAAIQSALSAAETNGGGIVYLPLGRYAVSETLNIPRRTVLRGEREDGVALAWTDLPSPPWALVQGTNTFGLENLTIYACHHRHVIAADLGDRPGAGDVFLRRVRVRANSYRGHPTQDEVNARFHESMKWSTGGGDTVRMGGRNIEITDCDFYGTGRALYLSRVRGGRVAGNRFFNGRWGWYCISGSDGLIFERNEISGADLMSTGGGLNCLDGSRYSQNVYYADNRLRLMHGWDREAMTSDAGGEAYSGKGCAVKGTSLTLGNKPNWRGREWQGAAVFVLAGRGAGQVRRVVGQGEQSVEIDRPWEVAPDADSDICVTMYQGHYLVIGNEFSDCGPMQFYGTAVENIVVRNTGTRMSGFRGKGLWYHGYQPNWFCEFRDNAITEGNYYHWATASDSVLEITGMRHAPYSGPMNIGSVVRGNRLDSNAHICITGDTRDAIVEANRVANSGQGIFVSRNTTNVLVLANAFENVREELTDEPALRRAAELRLSRYLNRPDPVAGWNFEEVTGAKAADVSGNGFSARVNGGVTNAADGVRGCVAGFDGTGWLRVNEPAVFNAPDMTASLWIKPSTVRGRRGLVCKRFAGGETSFILTQNGAGIGFEATDTDHRWSFNFTSPAVLKEGAWTHVAAVAQRGKGITLYADGKPVAEKKNLADRISNDEPLILGREQWGGEPAKVGTPGFFIGLMDEVKIWTRALTAAEIQSEFTSRP
ncbi:MAG TPA: glycosyl hydrolase family 28-related protein [Kiritimatiellia bacterium]|nr:glycosyl hydrolase family 28-related protein [Kiritimatiellia bacterium]HPS09191.1 glycosyl hydrolase family 28-related protein [Kiritimatiellia bacterium]